MTRHGPLRNAESWMGGAIMSKPSVPDGFRACSWEDATKDPEGDALCIINFGLGFAPQGLINTTTWLCPAATPGPSEAVQLLREVIGCIERCTKEHPLRHVAYLTAGWYERARERIEAEIAAQGEADD